MAGEKETPYQKPQAKTPRQRGRGYCLLKCQHIFGLYYNTNAAPTGLSFGRELHFYTDATPTGLKK